MFSSRADLGDGRRASPHVPALASLAGVLLMLAGCGSKTSMHDCDANGSCDEPSGDGGAGTSIDGAPTSSDARPGSTDAAPAGLCAGVDCSDLDDPCNQGICDPDTGECEPQPINEDMPCAEPVCGDFGTCAGFADTCDEIGAHVRTCQDLTCRAGACEVGMPYEDEQLCSRDTDGITCGDPQTSCGACGGFGSVCEESGMRTCTTTTFACDNGTCEGAAGSSTESCSRSTEGLPCGTRPCNFSQGTIQQCCNAAEACSVDCGECITPVASSSGDTCRVRIEGAAVAAAARTARSSSGRLRPVSGR